MSVGAMGLRLPPPMPPTTAHSPLATPPALRDRSALVGAREGTLTSLYRISAEQELVPVAD